MSSVTHLTQHLLKQDPQKHVARQTLFNYFKNFADGSSPLTVEMLNGFFLYALNFQYWQSNAKTLGEQAAADLFSFSQVNRLDFDLKAVRMPHETQVISLEHQHDFDFLLNKQEESLIEVGGRFKILKLSEQQQMVLLRNRSGGVRVRLFNRLAVVDQGQLRLLAPITDLTYSSDMELYPNTPQLLEGPMVMTARFQITDDGCQGLMVRGHMLQKYETLAGGALPQHPELFYSLKRVERHYVQPQSDPFYKELVTQLERTYQMLTLGHPDGRKVAPAALQRAKSALKNIFPNDKLLVVLVTNIEFALIPQTQTKDKWTSDETQASFD